LGELSRNQRRQVARARKRAEAMTAEAARVAEKAARAVNAAHAVERGAVAVARRAEHTARLAPLAPLGTGREIASWQVVAVLEAAAAVAREAAAGATRAPIDWARAHTRLDAGMVADRSLNRLLTVPQPLSGDISSYQA